MSKYPYGCPCCGGKEIATTLMIGDNTTKCQCGWKEKDSEYNQRVSEGYTEMPIGPAKTFTTFNAQPGPAGDSLPLLPNGNTPTAP